MFTFLPGIALDELRRQVAASGPRGPQQRETRRSARHRERRERRSPRAV